MCDIKISASQGYAILSAALYTINGLYLEDLGRGIPRPGDQTQQFGRLLAAALFWPTQLI